MTQTTPEGPISTPTAHLDRPGDSLALVQHTFGYMPERSLVLIGMAGGSSGGHLRVDLSPGAADPSGMARQCAEWIAGPGAEPAPEAVIALLFTAEAPGVEHHGVYDPLIDALAAILESEHDAELLHVWHAGAGRIRNYSCRDQECCPYPGFEAQSQLDESLRRLPELGVPAAGGPDALLAEFLSPEHRPSAASRRVMSRLASAVQEPLAAQDLLTLWDSAISRTQRAGGARWLHTAEERAAGLLSTLGTKRGRDALVPLASVGYLTALAGTVYHDASAHDLTGAAVGEGLRRELGPLLPGVLTQAELDRHLEEYAACWLGATGAPPQWARVQALESLMRELLPYAEAPEREAVLTLKAWIEWAKGRSSVSGAAVRLVREEFGQTSDCTMAELIDQFSHAFGVCPWARVKTHSYSWWRSLGRDASPKIPPAFRE